MIPIEQIKEAAAEYSNNEYPMVQSSLDHFKKLALVDFKKELIHAFESGAKYYQENDKVIAKLNKHFRTAVKNNFVAVYCRHYSMLSELFDTLEGSIKFLDYENNEGNVFPIGVVNISKREFVYKNDCIIEDAEIFETALTKILSEYSEHQT